MSKIPQNQEPTDSREFTVSRDTQEKFLDMCKHVDNNVTEKYLKDKAITRDSQGEQSLVKLILQRRLGNNVCFVAKH